MAREETLGVCVNRTEARLVREVARRDGMTVSTWCRRAVLRAAVERAFELEDEPPVPETPEPETEEAAT